MMSGQSGKATLWQGDVKVVEGPAMECPSGGLFASGARPGDRVVGPIGCEITIVFVETDHCLQVAGAPAAGWEGPVKIVRLIAHPCWRCGRRGQAQEADHIHCLLCEETWPLLPVAPGGAAQETEILCEDCKQKVRIELVTTGAYRQSFELFGGRLQAIVHAKTAQEGEEIAAWQEGQMRSGVTAATVIGDTPKAGLALTLDDDGRGRAPTGTGVVERMKSFDGYPDAYFKGLAVGAILAEGVVARACMPDMPEEMTKEELLVLGDRVMTADVGGDVLGEVEIFKGELTLRFCSPLQGELVRASAIYEEEFLASKEVMGDGSERVMGEGRASYIIGLARLATYFRGDRRQCFERGASIEERMAYLRRLPKALYDTYMVAGNIWADRVARASDVGLLGNC